MGTDTATAVPSGLRVRFDPESDPARGRHLILVVPWGAQVDPNHDEHGGWVLQRGDVAVDRGLLRARGLVNVGHDVRDEAGRIVDATVDDRGLWAVADFNARGEDVHADGGGRVSAELIAPGDEWLFVGLALVPSGQWPAVPGARVVFSRWQQVYAVAPAAEPGHHLPWLGRVAREADECGGRVVRNGAKAPPPVVDRMPGVVDMGERKRFLRSMSMQEVEEDVAYRRRRFQRRQEELRQLDVQDVKTRLVAGMVPHSQWPLWTSERRGWDRRQGERAAERERQREEAQRLQLQAQRVVHVGYVDLPQEEVSWLTRICRWLLR